MKMGGWNREEYYRKKAAYREEQRAAYDRQKAAAAKRSRRRAWETEEEQDLREAHTNDALTKIAIAIAVLFAVTVILAHYSKTHTLSDRQKALETELLENVNVDKDMVYYHEVKLEDIEDNSIVGKKYGYECSYTSSDRHTARDGMGSEITLTCKKQ